MTRHSIGHLSAFTRTILLLIILLVVGALIALAARPALGAPLAPSAQDALTAAWDLAQARGSYAFTGDVTQVTIPQATLFNVGRTSREERLYLEGVTNQREASADLRLWSDGIGSGGSTLIPASGIQIQIADGKTLMRKGGGEWEESPGGVDGYAPQGDFLAYLTAAKNVTAHDPETRSGIAFTRYTFEIDGPVYATYVRDQMQGALAARGELPPGVVLEPSAYYADMMGTGELWVGEDGLPLRQLLDLHFPPQNQEQVYAQISVIFSDYGQVMGPFAFLQIPSQLEQTILSTLGRLTGFALVLAFGAGVVLFRRRRFMQGGVAVTVSLLMVIGPALSNQQTGSFFAAQRAQAAETTRQIDASQSARDRQILAQSTTFDPHADALAAATGSTAAPNVPVAVDVAKMAVQAAARSTDTDGDGLSDIEEQLVGLNINAMDSNGNGIPDGNEDCDGDGLSNFQEASLGTELCNPDSDGDSIPDKQELTPFTLGGKQWATNPLEMDSNGDTLSDLEESRLDFDGDGLPDDTDGDGVPDLFDDDNDGDGVPDRVDLSPFSSVGSPASPFSAASPFSLAIQNLQPNAPAFLDIQIRPKNPEHLWYAFNVLDWPSDSAGQVQDVDNKTYAHTVQNVSGPFDPNPPADLSYPDSPTDLTFGDMRLSPMLEFRVVSATGATHLPPLDVLKAYNITVVPMTDDGTDTGTIIGSKIYAPVALVTDEQTGDRVAFRTRIPYLPATAAWGSAHESRLVWTVQILSDLPCDPLGPNAAAMNCEAVAGKPSEGFVYNVPQIVQTYDDEWYVTGLSVQEDRGASIGVIYEDPSVDAGNLNRNQALWPLIYGLDETFLGARQDLTVDQVRQRFDHTVNGGVSDQTRWSIPNILRVETGSYDQLDRAIATVTMTRTKQILAANFTAAWTPASPITPTLAYAQESTSRATSLDDVRAQGGYVTLSGNALTVNFAPAGKAQLTPTTTRSLSWMAYCAQNMAGVPVWDSCGPDQYADELAARYAGVLASPGDTPAMARGRLALLQTFYVTVARGATAVVNGTSPVTPPTDGEMNGRIAAMISNGGVNGVAKYVMDDMIAGWFIEGDMALEKVGDTFLTIDGVKGTLESAKEVAKLGNLQTKMGTKAGAFGASKTGALKGAGLVVVAAVVFGYIASEFIWPDSSGVAIWSAVGSLAFAVILAVDAISAVNSARGTVGALSSFKMASIKGAAVVAAVVIAAAWGYFVYSVFSAGVKFFSVEFNKAVATMIATTIVLVVLVLLSANPIGALFGALLALVDGILTLLCKTGVIDDGEDGDDCPSITGEVIKFVTEVLYSYDLMIEMDQEENPKLMDQGPPKVERTDRSKGFIASNALILSMPVTTTIFHKSPPLKNWQMVFYNWFFTAGNLRSSTFDYAISDTPNPLDSSRGTMENAWTVTDYGNYVGQTLYHGVAKTTVSMTKTFDAGINRALDYNFNSGYEVAAYECWTIPNPFGPPYLIPICYKRDKDGSNSSFVAGPQLDIFPNTLEEFVAVVPDGSGGSRLAWDSRFPTIYDSDGDGLVVSSKGGIDPDDRKPDTDGDGLPDRYELNRRLEGVGYGPRTWDTDMDGLSDSQEAGYGTDPYSRDTDNDGLDDGVEIYHEVMNPAPTGVWTGGWDVRATVWSNPNTAMTRSAITDTIGLASTITVRVSSDPRSADGDGDGIPDDVEREWAMSANLTVRIDSEGRPYHPNVFNTNPLQIFVATNLPDGFVGPGQTFIYTNTVSALQDFAPGVLEITLPRQVGNNPVTQSFNVSRGQSQTWAIPLTVQANAQTGTAELLSTGRARTPAQNSFPTLTWSVDTNPIAPNPAGRGISATSIRPDKADAFLLPAVVSDSAERGGRGDIWAYTLGGSALELQIADDQSSFGTTYLRSNTAPKSTCNDDGQCLVLWEHVNNCNYLNINRFYIDALGSDGAYGAEPVIMFDQNPGSIAGPPSEYAGDDPHMISQIVWWWSYWIPQNRGTGWVQGTDLGMPVWPPIFYCDPSANYDARITMGESDGSVVQVVGYVDVRPQTWATYYRSLGPNGPGDAFSVEYTHDQMQRNLLAGAIVAPPLGSGAISTVKSQFNAGITSGTSATIAELNPTTASDGKDFLTVFNMKNMSLIQSGSYYWNTSTSLLVRTISANGSTFGSTYSLDYATCNVFAPSTDYITGPNIDSYWDYDLGFAKTPSDILSSAVWTGDRYRVVWLRPTCDDSSGALWTADLNPNGSLISGTKRLVLNQVSYYTDGGITRTSPPSLAHDPVHDRSLVVFKHISGNYLTGMLWDDSTAAPQRIVLSPLVNGGPVVEKGSFPAVAYNPATGGWLLTWRNPAVVSGNYISYANLRADVASGAPASTLDYIYSPNPNTGMAVTCPAASTAPVLALALEEMPGATAFKDEVTGTNVGSCRSGNCPVVGVAGVGSLGNVFVGNGKPPRTDRAIYFNNSGYLSTSAPIQNDFTISFWVKPDPNETYTGTTWQDAGPMIWANAPTDAQNWGVSLGAGNRVLFGVGNTTVTGDAVTAGQWHQVIAIRDGSTGYLTLYVDGSVRGTQGSALNLVDTPNIYLGTHNSNFRGTLDYLLIYDTLFAPDAAGLHYAGTLKADLGYTPDPSYCVVTQPVGNEFEFYRISAKTVLPRGTGPVVNSAGISFDVDATPPSVTLDSLSSLLVDGQYLQAPNPNGPGSTTETLIIGGNADDMDSGVGSVSISLNGTDYPANGKATWTFGLPISEGSYTIQATAVDNVGNTGSSPQLTFKADGTPPDLNINVPGTYLIPAQAETGEWSFPVSGLAQDGGISIYTYMDESSVAVRVQSADGNYGDWQPAVLDTGTHAWALTYRLPVNWGPPNDTYTVTVRGADIVGNMGESSGVVELRSVKMDSTTTDADARLDPITEPVSLHGVITSTTGIASVQSTIVPVDEIVIYSDTVMHLPFDEPVGSVWFQDATLPSNNGRCEEFRDCPVAGETGKRLGALRFNGGSAITVPHSPSIDFDASENFTLMAWVKATAGNYPILLMKYGSEGSYYLGLDDTGRVFLELNDVEIVKSQAGIYNNTWTHVAVSVDRTGERVLYMDGQEAAYDPSNDFLASVANATDLDIGYALEGWMDDIMIFNRALSPVEMRTMMDASNRTWTPVVLGDVAGNAPDAVTPTVKTWQVDVPNGLEGFYQIDLQALDSRGNQRRIDSVWRGTVDTLAPRVTIQGNATGVSYVDPTSDNLNYDIGYTIRTEDQNLDPATIAVICGDGSQGARGFVNENGGDPWAETLFPDLALGNSLTFACHTWADQANPATQATACDVFGHCTTVDHTTNTGQVRRSPDNTSAPVIVWPPAGSVIAVNDTLVVTMSTVAGAALTEMGVMNMDTGQALDMLQFNPADNVTGVTAPVTLNLKDGSGNWILPQNSYNLGIQTTDVNGNKVVGPVFTFSWDTEDPTGAITTDVLAEADSLGVTSGIMRFHGTAGDSSGANANMGLATVQISVGDGPYVDAKIEKTGSTAWAWSAAVFVGTDPFGQNYTINVKMVDKAGRQTITSKVINVDIPKPEGFVPFTGPTPTPIPGATATPTPTATPTVTPTPGGVVEYRIFLPLTLR